MSASDGFAAERRFVDEEPSRRAAPHALGVLAVAAALGATAGRRGLAVGALLAAIWFFARPSVPYFIAAGHVALLALFPDGIALDTAAGIELAMLAAAVSSVPGTRSWLRETGAVVGFAAVLFGIAGVAVRATGDLWPAALALLAVVGLYGYGLHRVVARNLDGGSTA